jgi:hypothetical protein
VELAAPAIPSPVLLTAYCGGRYAEVPTSFSKSLRDCFQGSLRKSLVSLFHTWCSQDCAFRTWQLTQNKSWCKRLSVRVASVCKSMPGWSRVFVFFKHALFLMPWFRGRWWVPAE